jgi:hypothetical protein
MAAMATPMNGATITVNTPDDRVNTTTGATGIFKTGYANPGDYVVTISKPGFVTQTIPFTFTRAVVTEINVTLAPRKYGGCNRNSYGCINRQSGSQCYGQPHFANPRISARLTDVNGQFTLNCIAAANYTATAGAWGYLPELRAA